jgi:hypothetical protein
MKQIDQVQIDRLGTRIGQAAKERRRRRRDPWKRSRSQVESDAGFEAANTAAGNNEIDPHLAPPPQIPFYSTRLWYGFMGMEGLEAECVDCGKVTTSGENRCGYCGRPL